MSRVTHKLRILVAAVAVGGMMLGFVPTAHAADGDESGPAGLGFCIAGVGNCGGNDGVSSEEEAPEEEA